MTPEQDPFLSIVDKSTGSYYMLVHTRKKVVTKKFACVSIVCSQLSSTAERLNVWNMVLPIQHMLIVALGRLV